MTSINSNLGAAAASAYQKTPLGTTATGSAKAGGDAGPVSAIADSAVSFVSDAAKALYHGTITEAQQIQSAATAAYDTVVHGVQAVGNYVEEVESGVSNAVNATTKAVGSAVDAVEQGVDTAVDAVSDVASDVLNGIDDAAGAIAAYAVDGAKTVGQYLNITG
jgi:phage-related protein